MMLELHNVTKTFDGVKALSNVSMAVAEGDIVGIIGPNGSGKSTLFNIISRLVEPDAGNISFDGIDLLCLKPYEVARNSISRTFQTPQLCPSLTVYENVALGSYALKDQWHKGENGLTGIRGSDPEGSTGIQNSLRFVQLTEKENVLPASLSYFERRKLELARALVAGPKLLLLDEPTSGFAQIERDQFVGLILKIRAQGITVLIIEHDLALIHRVSDRVIVLDVGSKIAEGNPESIARNKAVAEIYVGTSDAAA